MDSATRRKVFLVLAAVALLALVAAVVTVLAAPEVTGVLLAFSLGVLFLVVGAEVVLLIQESRQ